MDFSASAEAIWPTALAAAACSHGRILVYSVAAFAAGIATSVVWLLVFRTAAFAGSCVEFVAAVAWLAEIFTEPKQREAIIGYTQAFSSLGGVLSAEIFYVANRYGTSFPADCRRALRMALPADLRHDPGAAADLHPPLPA